MKNPAAVTLLISFTDVFTGVPLTKLLDFVGYLSSNARSTVLTKSRIRMKKNSVTFNKSDSLFIKHATYRELRNMSQ